MFIRWKYVPAPQYADQSILGVPPQKIGQLQYVGWGEKRQVLLQIDELVMREGVKRRLDLHESYLDMIIYGFIDPVTHEDRWHTEADAGDDGSDPDTETEYSDSDSERLDEADWEGNESGLDSDHEGGDGLGSKTEEDGSSSSTAQEQNPDDSEWEDMD